MHTDPAEPLRTASREVMAGVATPVSAATTVAADRRPHGTTVSAFASLSMDPPMVLVVLDRGSELLVLSGDPGWLPCEVAGTVDGGDHEPGAVAG